MAAKKKTATAKVEPRPAAGPGQGQRAPRMRAEQVDAWINHAAEMLERVVDQGDEENAAKASAALEELR